MLLLALCCKECDGLVNGNIVRNVEDIPYLARISIKTGFAFYASCGASLISSQFLLTAKHCLTSFDDECINEIDCVAHFRDLKTGRTDYEPGQFFIPITKVFYKEGIGSDLAVIKLKNKVEEHPEYSNGPALRPIRLATENPVIGEKCLTAGWGVIGYNEEASVELRSLELRVTSAVDNWVYTSNYDDEGRLTDTGGDAGGPLACWRDGVWEIVGVLKGEGYDWRTNTTNGDGQWSSVAVQRTWVFNSQIRPRCLRLLSQWTVFGHPGPPGVAAVAPVEEVQENGIVLVHLRLLKEDPVVEGLKTKKSVELKDAQVKMQSM